jgi:hypothetical protein
VKISKRAPGSPPRPSPGRNRFATILCAAFLVCLLPALVVTGPAPKSASAQTHAQAASTEADLSDLEPSAVEFREEIREKLYFYQAFTSRDPFKSLLEGEFEKKSDLVNVYAADLVGVMRGAVQEFAMVEDNDGMGFILKVGDPVQNGKVISITEKTLVARVTSYGQTSNVTLKLERQPASSSGSTRNRSR